MAWDGRRRKGEAVEERKMTENSVKGKRMEGKEVYMGLRRREGKAGVPNGGQGKGRESYVKKRRDMERKRGKGKGREGLEGKGRDARGR